jgi:hypothetical protein
MSEVLDITRGLVLNQAFATNLLALKVLSLTRLR